MNFRTKLESREGRWIRVHFMDSSNFTGVLRQIGSDYIEIECFERDDNTSYNGEVHGHSLHIIPIQLIKLITIETSLFMEAERKRLEYIAMNSRIPENCDLPEMER